MQDLDRLDKAGADQVTGCIGEAADAEVIADRYAVDKNRDAVAADAANVDALGPEACAGPFEVDARQVAEYVGHRISELEAKVVAIEDADRRGNVPAGTRMLVSNNEDFLNCLRSATWRCSVGAARGCPGTGRADYRQHKRREA